LKEQNDSCLYEKGDTGKDLKKQEKKAKNKKENLKDDIQKYGKQEL